MWTMVIVHILFLKYIFMYFFRPFSFIKSFSSILFYFFASYEIKFIKCIFVAVASIPSKFSFFFPSKCTNYYMRKKHYWLACIRCKHNNTSMWFLRTSFCLFVFSAEQTNFRKCKNDGNFVCTQLNDANYPHHIIFYSFLTFVTWWHFSWWRWYCMCVCLCVFTTNFRLFIFHFWLQTYDNKIHII